MKMNEIRKMAKALGVDIAGLDKREAVRRIQRAEGNFDCYAKATGCYCDQVGCLFRDDCLKESCWDMGNGAEHSS